MRGQAQPHSFNLEIKVNLKQLARPAMVLIGWSLAFGVMAFGGTPMKIIVPAPAGGTMDVVARIVGQQMSTEMGRPVIVENRAGATGSIGLQAMLQAVPDGNTIVLGADNLLVESPLVSKVPYDPLKDIVSIARVARTNRVLVTAAANPAKDFQAPRERGWTAVRLRRPAGLYVGGTWCSGPGASPRASSAAARAGANAGALAASSGASGGSAPSSSPRGASSVRFAALSSPRSAFPLHANSIRPSSRQVSSGVAAVASGFPS